jgi:hypothetical protein
MDSHQAESNVATVSINFFHAITAESGRSPMAENFDLLISPTDLFTKANLTTHANDPDKDRLTARIDGQPQNGGQASIDDDGVTVTYTPPRSNDPDRPNAINFQADTLLIVLFLSLTKILTSSRKSG